ncbi:lipopolysaccharide heptosyltransferase RfaC [Citrobacter freundii complex sp. 2024EL-00228]|jgi:heptosyltransferase-1|uniref:Lipopolysaccharide heptosyltransferase 1 n=1 Tax=Citrobacter freundii TaxID=546 RepID=A0A9P4DHR8_CITFR|nr:MULTISPECIES: lipopolysaccharide heptosyltransferase RfaC [Citrobacter]EIN8658307.1 lipopolysaccharide heptosyltransferase RfaC [Citrobacter freundii]EJC8216901.1 lipopolysaccharide heptosyltransferase RfaC [Citrobacter freundii]ELK7554913.1 lipopolysaccharide heptosyltransferase RfaC [Citrobacter freundii]MBJ9314115.1 lipopolysaccharide heptosyltransferase RfaC [Citrobacter freundii]MDH1409002.1 lipopolysaccharide heptosyltransferase RfaC [Citrobacter freundii]
MRVLIVKTSSMGDVLHTLPALTDAQQAIPGIQFDWVVEEGFAQIPSWHAAVDRVIPVAIRRWRKAWFSAPIKAERKAFRDAVRLQQYDAIIDAQGLVKSAALVTRLACGVKHGMDWSTAREPLASLFYNRKHHIAKQQHAVERTRELFAKSLGYAKPQSQGDYAIAQHFVNECNADTGHYAVFLHATTRDDKHWPEANWRELIELLNNTGIRIKLPWGAPHEEERAKRLAEGFPYVDVLPRMSLEEVARILAGAKFVVSVDTGLSHLTAALDRPNITLYGPTDPGLIGGYGKNQYTQQSHSGKLQDLDASLVNVSLIDNNLL